MPRFTLLRRGQVERSFTHEGEVIRIGRLAGIEVVLDAPTVSREHASIRRRGSGHVLEDAGSVNGVRLNGQRILRQALLPGDRVEIEEFQLVFEPSEELFLSGLDPELQAFARKLGDKDPSLTFLNVNRILGKE